MKKKKPEQKYRYLDDPWEPSIEKAPQEIQPAEKKKVKLRKHKKEVISTPPTLPPVWTSPNKDDITKKMAKKFDQLYYQSKIFKWSCITSSFYLILFVLFYFTQYLMNDEIAKLYLGLCFIIPLNVGIGGILFDVKKIKGLTPTEYYEHQEHEKKKPLLNKQGQPFMKIGRAHV